ncbi:LOB domain-containing protein 39-like isoform X2 [Tasmannia lanceolata]|uniref:LOB domain-containing protein 39-like isoform X2 n=1 Tax=Tasmannia lanceolata TaxID=3420 RepID=UPI0040647767
MSCNGCRVLRKGCRKSCILRPCLQFIQTPEAQGYATIFVAKFFGRAGLMSFISSVTEIHRPACGRTLNPVYGAIGLLWTGNWNLCQEAVEIVLSGGTIRPMSEFATGVPVFMPESDSKSEDEVRCTDGFEEKMEESRSSKRTDSGLGSGSGFDESAANLQGCDLDLSLMSENMNSDGSVNVIGHVYGDRKLLNLFV